MARHRAPLARRSLVSAILALALVGVVACSPPTTDSASSAGSAGPQQGQITLLTASLPESLNPIAGFANTGKGKINESLLTLEGRPDALPDIVPHLASALPRISADGRTWTVPLRSDVTFSDGSPLTAQDVVATYEAIADPASASPLAGDPVNLAGVTASDAQTVVFTLREPQVSFRTALLIGIAPKGAITPGQQVGDSPLTTAPVGTGPYVVDSFSADRLVLTANPAYRLGPVPMSRITYSLAADDNTRAQRMRAGEFDGSVLPPRLAQPFDDDGAMDVVTATSADWRGLSLPAGNPVTADPAMRQALNTGIDREALVNGVLAGKGRPASTFVPPQYGRFYDPAATFTYDLEASKAALEAAGWRVGDGGIRVKDGRRAAFTLMYRPTDMLRRDLSAAFASEALKLGVDVTIEGVEFAQAEPRMGTDALLLGGGDTPYDVDTQVYKSLHSSYPAAGAYYDNPSRYVNAAMDKALDEGRTSTDEDTRVGAYRRVQQLYVADPSMVLLVFLDHVYLQRTSIAQEWNTTPTLLEPHEHGTAWGPWVDIDRWTPKG